MANAIDAESLREKLVKTEAKLKKARAKIRELKREVRRHEADLEMRLRDVAKRGDAMRFLEWLQGPDAGLSSMAIGYHMLGVPIRGLFRHPPADSGDLARCEALLQIFPHWRPRMIEMKDKIGWARAAAKLGGSNG